MAGSTMLARSRVPSCVALQGLRFTMQRLCRYPYGRRQLSQQDKDDLVAFLNTL